MLWILSFHIIAMVAWFAGLFYLPRLFVYHAKSTDNISNERFKIMERRLYYGIMNPAGFLTVALGLWLLSMNWHYYSHAIWMHIKLSLVILLIIYHLFSGWMVGKFARDKNPFGPIFYRIYNEIPTLLLITIVILVVVKPF